MYAFELELGTLGTARKPEFAPASQFPASYRDISLLVPIDRSSDAVMKDIREAAGDGLTLESLRVFDVYAGKGIPDGMRSLAYTLSYRAQDRTLTVDEVEAVHNKVREGLKAGGYTVR